MTQGDAALSHRVAEKVLSTHSVPAESPSGLIPDGGIKPHGGEAEQSEAWLGQDSGGRAMHWASL